jgi:hypothetical protein
MVHREVSKKRARSVAEKNDLATGHAKLDREAQGNLDQGRSTLCNLGGVGLPKGVSRRDASTQMQRTRGSRVLFFDLDSQRSKLERK